MEKVKVKIADIKAVNVFEVEEGQSFVISDPCYREIEAVIPNTDTKINHKVKAKAGTWVYKFDPIDRVLSVYEKNNFDAKMEELDLTQGEFDKVVDLCVDSGQVGVFLESSYRNNSLVECIELENTKYKSLEDNEWYRACCEIVRDGNHMGFIPYGFVTATRWGDGFFPAGLIYEKGTDEVVYIRIETHHLFRDENYDMDDEYYDMDDEYYDIGEDSQTLLNL